jgi:hypothetical protein
MMFGGSIGQQSLASLTMPQSLLARADEVIE